MVAPASGPIGNDSFIVQPMDIDDIAEVRAIERQCFSTPWPRESFRHELERNRMARYLVLRRNNADLPPSRPGLLQRVLGGGTRPEHRSIVGFAGIWMMVDEAHITTLAVSPEFQGCGLGEILLIALTELSRIENAKVLTLEVRQSNIVAQGLYGKYGFSERGIRPRYYSDDGEDALVMWSEELNSLAFEKRFRTLHANLQNRLMWESRL